MVQRKPQAAFIALTGAVQVIHWHCSAMRPLEDLHDGPCGYCLLPSAYRVVHFRYLRGLPVSCMECQSARYRVQEFAKIWLLFTGGHRNNSRRAARRVRRKALRLKHVILRPYSPAFLTKCIKLWTFIHPKSTAWEF